ncbi:MAG: vitamin K epoxide reductase family protein [Armatimonadetes bacterium]|nr:vitamin K epoxide reductase family protein [Armatimonadota bacterium]
MTKKASNFITIALALVGAGITSLLTYKHFVPEISLGCSASGGCGSVLSSYYSHVGPIPTSLIGLGMYLTIIGICLARHKRLKSAPAPLTAADMDDTEPSAQPIIPGLTPLNRLVWGLATVGVLVSWTLQYVSISMLHSLCPYCLSSAITITLLFLFASKDFWLERRTLDSEQKLVIGVIGAVMLCGVLVYLPKIAEFIGTPLPKPKENPEAFAKNVIRPTTHIKGDPKAPLTLVEFADLQCDSCKRGYPKIEAFIKSHPKQFRYAFRHCPLSIHRMGFAAAVAAEAAGKQGKFWEMVSALFLRQELFNAPMFNESSFTDIAKELGLDANRFEADLKSNEIKDIVVESSEDTKDGGITATPSFVVIKGSKLWKFNGAEKLFNALEDKTHEMYR